MYLRKITKIVVLAFLPVVLFNSCKKGEDDPTFSLRSRKARVVGDWHIESGTVSLTFQKKGTAPFNRRITFANSKATMTETYQGGIPTIYTGNYLLNMSFKKDGTFEISETFAGTILKASGTWNFGYGIGETKKKETIILTLDASSNGGTDYGLFNKFSTELTYKIKELRNKKMVFEASNQLYANADGSHTTYESNYSLIQ